MAGLNGTSRNGRAAIVVEGVPAPLERGLMHDDPIDDLEAERSRLERELVAARARTTAARDLAAGGEARMRAALHAELLAARERLMHMEREHDRAVADIRAAAQLEIERILGAGRDRPEEGRDAG